MPHSKKMKIDQFLTHNDSCPVCHSNEASLCEKNKNNHTTNFYIEAIEEALNLDKKEVKEKIKAYSCKQCGTIFCNPWFNSQTSFDIFQVIYGQHNRGWSALFGWLDKKPIQDYWQIIDFGQERLNRKINSYAEYHCPFQGNFFQFREQELPLEILPEYYQKCHDLITASCPGKELNNDISKKSNHIQTRRSKALKDLSKLDELEKPVTVKRFLALETSVRFWDASCSSDGVNCKPLASKLLNVNVLPFLEFKKQSQKVDIFAFINTLDHSHDPMKLIRQALEFSELVFVVNHAQDIISKQHKFLFQSEFVDFLDKQPDLTVEDLTHTNSFKSDEINTDKIALVLSKAK